MTTMKLLSVLIIVMGISSTADANDSTYRKSLRIVPKPNAEVYRLIYQSEQAEPVWVSIKDVRGNLLINEKYSRTDGFILPLNLEEVGSGQYEIEVRTKTDLLSETLDHTSQADYYKDHLFLQQNNDLIALVGFDLGVTDLQLYIYDDETQLVHKEELTTTGLLQKEYDLSSVDTEKVEVLIYHKSDLLMVKELHLQ